jgi:ATP-dependent Clp protease ATP-binding subunit ClpA
MNLPFTPNSKKSLDLAARIAKDMGHEYVSNKHLLLALLKDPSEVGDLFKKGGVDYATVERILFPEVRILMEFTD